MNSQSALSLSSMGISVAWEGDGDGCWCWLVWLMGYGLSLIGHEIERKEGVVCGLGD